MTEYRGSGSRAAIILNFGTNGGKLSASRLGHLTPWEIVPSTNCTGVWVGSKPGLVALKKSRVKPR
jgi:hypothetical protein